MNQEQKEKALASANVAKNKVVALWKSGKTGKGIIIGVAVVVLGIIGSFMDSPEKGTASSADTPKTASSESKTPAKKKAVVKEAGKSILNFVPDWRSRSKEHKELYEKFHNDDKVTVGHAHATRYAIIEKLYENDFRSPITDKMAEIDSSKPRYSLFGGTLKAGAEIDIPESNSAEPIRYFCTKLGENNVEFTRHRGGKDIRPNDFADETEIWRMEYSVKEFMGLTYTKTLWYRAPGSNKLQLFYAMVRNDHAESTKVAHEIRKRMIEAVQKKYPEMSHTFTDEISDEYAYNGDILTVEQSVKISDMAMFDAPWVQVGIITPSIVVKILKSLDEQDKNEFEAAKKADAGALDNF